MLEDFLRLLQGDLPAQPIWTADLSYWVAGRQQDGTADPAWETEEGYLQLHADLGVMPYYYYPKFGTWRQVFAGDTTETTGEEGDRTVRTFTTPVGVLREESTFLPESCCTGVTKHMVQDEADLDVLLYLLEHRRLEPANLDDYDPRCDLWARYGGLPCLGLPRSPLSALAYEWADIQSLTYLLLDCEDKVRECLARLEAQEAPILEAVCALAPPLVHFPDNLSSDNLTGFYDEFMAPAHRRRLAALHAAGIKTAVHLDGTVRGLLPKLVQSGFDAIEALTPQPAGDLTVDEMATLADNDSIILWGGAPGALFAPPHSWADLEAHVQHTLATWGGRPFVLGVADQVPPDGDIEFCRRIAALCGRGASP